MSLIALAAGRPRKPTTTKALQGTLRPSRTNSAEPIGDPIKIPTPPTHLSKLQKKIWKAVAKDLDPRRIITAPDLHAFELLVVSLAICREANDALQEAGSLTEEVVTQSGARTMARPEVNMLATHHKLALLHLSRFGLSPADRSRVSSLGDVKGEDPLSEFDDE